MATRVGPQDFDLLIKFGGGLHTRPAEDDINEREAADGQNFQLDLERRELKPRKPFDLVATAPNAGSILGGGSFLDSAGVVHAFFQAGTNVYEFDGASLPASPVLDTVSSAARLRAHFRSHTWNLDDLVLITDLGLVEVVKQWDGTTWGDIAFLSAPSVLFGTFIARYCQVSGERAYFGNTKDAAATPMLIVGSKLSDYRTISVSDRPSSSLGEDDPFFLQTPDLRPINGMVEAFNRMIISSEQGSLFSLTGASAKDFSFDPFYPGSAAAGAESLAYVGNDIMYGRPGRIESVRDTDRSGDTEADDVSRGIADIIQDYTGWTTVYNSRLNRVYLFPTGVSEVWVLETAIRDEGQLSPWMRWKTKHALAFRPTFVMAMLDPADGLEYVFMGDSSGHIYRMEGDGEDGDSGTAEIETMILSKLFSLTLDQEAYQIEGYIKYRKANPNTVTLVFEYAGKQIYNYTLNVDLPEAAGGSYFNGQAYFGGDFYFGSISGRFTRQRIEAAGKAEEFQLRVKVIGTKDFAVSEIGLRFKGASS